MNAPVVTGCILKERDEWRRESIHVNNAESRYFIVSITKNSAAPVLLERRSRMGIRDGEGREKAVV